MLSPVAQSPSAAQLMRLELESDGDVVIDSGVRFVTSGGVAATGVGSITVVCPLRQPSAPSSPQGHCQTFIAHAAV
jgi:hypothetical protein